MWKPKKWMPVLIAPKFLKLWSMLNGFDVIGITLPLLIIIDKYDDSSEKKEHLSKQLINHESIHIMQQIELLVVGFYGLYILNYLFNLLIYRNHEKAYMNIIFEKEAYINEDDHNYLNYRKPFSWLKYFNKSNPKF